MMANENSAEETSRARCPRSFRLWRTVRHLRAGQVVGRVLARGERALARLRGPGDWPDGGTLKPVDQGVGGEIAEWRQKEFPDRHAWHPSRPGVFRFLEDSHDIGFPPDWEGMRDARDPALWRFHLHYWDWMWGAVREEPMLLLEAARDWMMRCRPGAPGSFAGPASPYTVARRLPNWVLLWREARRAGLEVDWLARAIAAQARWLSNHLEWEHRGNHLLENLCALAFVDYFLEPEKRLLPRRALVDQLEEQVLDGGFHGEGSAMYHCLVLDRLLDLISLERDAPGEGMPSNVAQRVTSTARKMAVMLEFLLPTDGSLPLLGDSAGGMAPEPKALLARAKRLLGKWTDNPARSRAGHWVWKSAGGDHVIFDAAPGGLEFLGAHQHADLLNLQIMLSGKWLVCSGGAGIYREGRERALSRSSHSHATVVVDGVSCAEPWKSFRLGRRGTAWLVAEGEDEEAVWAVGRHDGFSPIGLGLERRVEIEKKSAAITVTDRLFVVPGGRAEKESYQYVGYLPLGAGVDVLVRPNGVEVKTLEDQKKVAIITFLPRKGGRLRLMKGLVYTRFGKGEPRTILRHKTLLRVGESVTTRILPA